MRISTPILLTFLLTLAFSWTARAAEVSAAPADAKPAGTEAENLFAKGREALFQGKSAEAIDLLAKAVAADKTKTSYRLALARAYRYAGKDEQAIASLEEILKAAPDHVEAGQMLGELYTAAKQWKDVVRVLDPLLKYRHDYPTYHMLAEAQNNLNDRDKARKSYEEALKLNPQSAPDHYQLGNLYLAANFFALAADSYHEALRLGLDSPVLRYKLGSAYFNLRNYFGAISVQTIKSGTTGTIDGAWYLIEAVPDKKDVFRCARRTRPSTRLPRRSPTAFKTGPTSTCCGRRSISTRGATHRLTRCSRRSSRP